MKDSIKCCLISMGIGFALGAIITANNKKASSAVKEAQAMAMEKLEMAKEGISTVKEKIADGVERLQEDAVSETKSKTQNKTKASK